ncbi:host-nuclease inhibitor Gam family protein [Vandammella animalimorsus]|nr:host-nuclease inhibitor Gam family protein [Vandammella animalimorsus]
MATRMKKPAQVAVPQSRNDCAEYIRNVGDLTREQARLVTEMNDQIAAITQRYQPELEGLQQRIDTLHEGIQSWCEAHRVELCGENDKLGKSVNFVTGTVSWRQRPPSVRVTGQESVIDTLLRMGLERFVRTKEEINKDAILNERDSVRGIAGIKIITGVEDFIVEPFEASAEV